MSSNRMGSLMVDGAVAVQNALSLAIVCFYFGKAKSHAASSPPVTQNHRRIPMSIGTKVVVMKRYMLRLRRYSKARGTPAAFDNFSCAVGPLSVVGANRSQVHRTSAAIQEL